MGGTGVEPLTPPVLCYLVLNSGWTKYLHNLVAVLLALSLGTAWADGFAVRVEAPYPETIPATKLEFLLNSDPEASLLSLERGEWLSNLPSAQSLVEGYWVRFRVNNALKTRYLGLAFNYNREKALYVVASDYKKKFSYWRQGVDPWIDSDRILSDHRLTIQPGQTAVVYAFFRQRPFDRYMGVSSGLDRMSIGAWEVIQPLTFGALGFTLIFAATALAFGLYYFLVWVVSRGAYLWLGLSLLWLSIIATAHGRLAAVFDFSPWVMYSELSLVNLSLLCIFLLLFFSSSLQLQTYNKKAAALFKFGIGYYFVVALANSFSSFFWPDPSHFDLITYPPDQRGPGLIKAMYVFPPILIYMLSAAYVAVKQWREGSRFAQYLALSFALPLLGFPIAVLMYLTLGFSTVMWAGVSGAVGILILAMFITFGFAVAQQMEDIKAVAMEYQIRLTRAYQRFVPPQLLANLGKESILNVGLGDQIEAEMSILFADIRSFTSISERLSPTENFRFVNDFLQEIGPSIRQHGGYIDKFLGDGVMALFVKSPADAINAAIDMQQRILNFNERQVASGGFPITIGIGINTGRMMLGTLGEADRMEGSVISDSVNLASRLESLTKVYGSRVLVSDETASRAKNHGLNFRFVDRVIVKGKSDPVSIFEVLNADDQQAHKQKIESLERYEHALTLYRKKEFTAALSEFKVLRSLFPDDAVFKTYAQRCEVLLRDGWSSEDWDGVMRMQDK